MASKIKANAPHAFDERSAQLIARATRLVLGKGLDSQTDRRRWPIPEDGSSLVWGHLSAALANNAYVDMTLDVWTKDTGTNGSWAGASPTITVRVTARNVPAGKSIPSGSVVGASQIGVNAAGVPVYCVVVSDCPMPTS